MKETMIGFLSDKYGWTAEEIEAAEDFEQLGLDSLSLYSLVDECEEKFGIHIDTDDITEINTPEKLIRYVAGKKQQ